MSSFRKKAAGYFLAISIPATLASLFGLWTFYGFLQVPPADDSEHRMNIPFIMTCLVGLSLFTVVGLGNLRGYYLQFFHAEKVPVFFWKWSTFYNVLLCLVILAFLFSLGWPFAVDVSISIVISSLIGMPLIGFFVSWVCVMEQKAVQNDRVAQSKN